MYRADPFLCKPTYLSSLPSEHKVNTRCHHSALFLALASASPQVRSRLFSSLSMVFRQVVFGLPLGLLPAGVHLRAIFGIDDLSILKTCPSHRSRFCLIWFSIQMKFVNFSKFVFVMVFGQNTQQICLRQLWWKLESDFMSVLVTLQHSLPYSNTDLTLLLYSFIFVFLLYWFDFQIGLSLWKVVLAFDNLFLCLFGWNLHC